MDRNCILFSPGCAKTLSLDATESKSWIGNFNAKARKTTEANSTKSGTWWNLAKKSGKREHPW